MKKRYELRLKELNFKPWREDAPNQPNTCVDFVISGDHDRMTEIAFGKPMDFDWQEDNSWVSLADDPNHPGMKMIETMAMDYYDFLCRKFGEENVIGLECHLDEELVAMNSTRTWRATARNVLSTSPPDSLNG